MKCAQIREAISAVVDGEPAPIDERHIAEHLQRCGPCRTYRAHAIETRHATLNARTPVPDLTQRIVRDIRPRDPLIEWPARIALFTLAVAQLSLAIPGLIFGSDEGAPIHIAHEVGSWDVALAVGFIFVAWRPLRAVGMLPFVAALSCMLIATAAFDLLRGHAEAVFETTHLLEVAGSLLLWYLARPVSPRNFTPRAGNREPIGTAERHI